MKKYFRLFEALKKIYGSKFVSDLFGKKRTNIIKLPPKQSKDFVKKELNIAEAGDKAVEQGKKDLAELVLDVKQIEKLNDQELLTLTNNAERMAQRTNPESFKSAPADIIDMRTQETVPSEGIASLLETSGQKAPPGTLMGNLESRIKQLEASGEDLSKMKGQTLDDIMRNEGQAQKGMAQFQKEGLVKATANDIMIADMKSGKFPVTKEMQQEILEGSPKSLDYFRRFYGEDALEVLDSLIPDLAKMRTSREAAEFAKKQYNFEAKMDRAPGSIDLDDAKKAEQEFNIIPADSEEGKVITEKLIGKPKAPVTELVTVEKIILDMKNMDPMDAMKEANKVLKKEGKYKNLKEEDVERIMEDTNDFIFGRDIPEEPEDFATGGRVGMAGGGIIKLVKKAMEFFGDNDPVSAYKKYLKYVKETAQKDPAKLAPEVGGIVVGSELIHRGLRRKLKEVKEKNNENDSENFTTNSRTKKAGGGVSQGLDYLMGIERRGYQEGSVSQEGVIPGFTRLINPDGAPGNYNEFMYEGPDGQIYGAGTYSSIAAGQYPNIYNPNTLKSYSNIPELTQLMNDVNEKAGTTVIRNFEEADAYLKANAQTTPTEDLSTNLNTTTINTSAQTTPKIVAEETGIIEQLYPQGDFLNIKETATSPTEYNIEATKDLVENLPSFLQPIAPAAAGVLSLPYDAIQAYQRMEPGSGVQGFGKAYQAERPLQSAFERFVGASGPLANNINTAVGSLNPYQQKRYMNYAVENLDRAIQAAQRDQNFRTSIQNRDQKQKGGLSYLLGF
jgi:hypothetical protein